jgi:transposase
MSRSYSEDLRIRLVRHVESGASRRGAAKLFGVSASIAVKWMQRWRNTKSVAPSSVRGHRRQALAADSDWLMQLVREKPDITLAEIRALLTRRGVRVSLSTIWTFYERNDVSFKKKRLRQRTGPPRRGGRPRKLAQQSKAA